MNILKGGRPLPIIAEKTYFELSTSRYQAPPGCGEQGWSNFQSKTFQLKS